MADHPNNFDRDPGWQAETIQPDPVLKERQASPTILAIATIFAVIIVTIVFYGLSDQGSVQTAGSSKSTPPSTSGQASSDVSGPSPADQANTVAHGKGANQSSATPQPANQGEGDAASPSRPGGK